MMAPIQAGSAIVSAGGKDLAEVLRTELARSLETMSPH
jgi:hypothetical protein